MSSDRGPIPESLARAEVFDREGMRSRLEQRWAAGPAVLVFLRHFACVACHEHVALLAPRLVELTRLGLRVVFIGNGAPHFIDGFIERAGIDEEQVEVVTDPTLEAFRAAQMIRSVASTVGPRALLNYGRALLGGFVQTSVQGDSLQQGGVVVIDRAGHIAYVHRDRTLGDHAPTHDVVDAAMRVAATGARMA